MGDHPFTCLDVNQLAVCSSRGQPSCHPQELINPNDDDHQQPQQKSSDAVLVVVVQKDAEGNHATINNIAECRICQEEEEVIKLDNPCACSGSVKYAHRKCVQRWCDEKGDTTCEICRQHYKSGYTASPPPRPQGIPINDASIDLSDEYTIELGDQRLLAMAAAQRHFLDAEYEEANSSSAACCRSAALILMVLLLLRHAIAIAATSTQENSSMFFTLFVIRAAGFLLPCYIMVRAMNILQRRHQQQEATAMAAAEVAIILQAGQQARGNMHSSSSPNNTNNSYNNTRRANISSL